jgi:hypothetical protein
MGHGPGTSSNSVEAFEQTRGKPRSTRQKKDPRLRQVRRKPTEASGASFRPRQEPKFLPSSQSAVHTGKGWRGERLSSFLYCKVRANPLGGTCESIHWRCISHCRSGLGKSWLARSALPGCVFGPQICSKTRQASQRFYAPGRREPPLCPITRAGISAPSKKGSGARPFWKPRPALAVSC